MQTPFDPQDPSADVFTWRVKALTIMFWVVVVIRALQILAYFSHTPLRGRLLVPHLVYLGFYALALGCAFCTGWPHQLRGWCLIGLGYATQINNLVVGARFGSQVPVALVLMPVNCAILMGRVSAWVAASLSAVLLLVLALLVHWHIGGMLPAMNLSTDAGTAVLGVLVVFAPMLVLMDRFVALFQRLLASESGMRMQLQHEARERIILEGALLESSERERRTVGHELHDGVCQQITGAMLHCKAVEQAVTRGRLPEAHKLQAITAMLDNSLGQVHDLAQGLSPGALGGDALVPGLRDLARRTREVFEVACVAEFQDVPELLPPATTTHLYRIAQEGVANAVKHGQATWIGMRLAVAEGRLTLVVSNDGKPPVAARGTGMGMRIMRYRSDLIGATLDFRARPGAGAELSCSLPVAP